MITINDFIQGEKFIQIADFAFCHNNNDFNVFENTFTAENVNKCEKNILIVYSHIHWAESLFKYINDNKISKRIILVTHNSDHEVNEELFNKKPENIVKWYSQNVNYIHKDLISIPIGLENNRWFFDEKKKEKLIDLIYYGHKKIINLLYINHSIKTFPNERSEPYEIFKDNDWCTLVHGYNGYDYNQYINNVFNHPYTLCARGNGFHTHREFECLYAGNQPIVIKNINNSQYSDLPIVYVDSWKEITKGFLEVKYLEFHRNKLNNIYNFEKLKFSYWRDLIFKTANRI